MVMASVGAVSQAVHSERTDSLDYGFATGNPYLAADSTGALYVPGSSQVGGIFKIPAGCGSASCVTSIGKGVFVASTLGVDATGNIYYADILSGGISKIPAGCLVSSCIVPFSSALWSTLGTIYDISVDSAGNVYFSTDAPAKIYKIAAGCTGTACEPALLLTRSSGALISVKADNNGNVYFTNLSEGAVYKLPAGCKAESCLTSFGAIDRPLGIALDPDGAVYVSTYRLFNSGGTVAGTVTVRKFPAGCSTAVCMTTLFSSNIVNPNGPHLPVDLVRAADGKIYFADLDTGRIAQYTPNPPIAFDSTAVGTPGPTTTITFVFYTGGKIGAPLVTTEGATGLDFVDAGGGTCTTIGTSYTYGAGDTCTVMVNFSPRYPGLRRGAVQMKSATGDVLATVYLAGNGTGPQVAFGPVSFTNFGGGVMVPSPLAVDGNGTVMVATNYGTGGLYRIPADCLSYACTLSTGTPYPSIRGVAFDGAGNLFLSDLLGQDITEYPAGCFSLSCTKIILPSANGSFRGLAIDGSGNLYTADGGINAIRKIPIDCLSMSCTTVMGGGLNNPFAVAVDGDGNVYVTDSDNNVVKKVPAGCASSSCVITVGGGFSSPTGIAVTGGTLFVSEANFNTYSPSIKSMPLGCVASGCVTKLEGTYPWSRFLAADAMGRLYVPNESNGSVARLERTTAPTVAFASTAVGQLSSDSPRTVTLYNTGNQPLMLTTPASGLNPTTSESYTFDTSGAGTCPSISPISSPGAVAAGSSCTLPILFLPMRAGNNAGTLAISDTNLNASPSVTQTIQLSGTGVASNPPTIVPASQSISAGTANALLSVTISYGGTAPLGAVSFVVGSGPYRSATCGTRGSAQFSCTVAYPTSSFAVGTYGITVLILADSNYASGTGASTLTVTKAPVQITTLPTASSIPYGQTLASSTLTGGVATVPGTFAWTSSSTVPAAGTNAYQVTFTPTDTATYNLATGMVNVTAVAAVGTINTANLAANQVTLQLASTVAGTGYFTMLPGSGATCGSVAQTVAGRNGLGDAVIHGSVKLAANVATSYTVRSLTQSTAYTVCFVPDNISPLTAVTVTTKASVAMTNPAWAAIGTAGFSAGTALSTSLAFAPDGTLYVAYQDAGNGNKATVMKWSGTAWVAVGGVGFSAGAAATLSLVFGPDGAPYVSYQDGSGFRLTVMKFDGTQWTPVGSAAFTSGISPFPALAIGPDNVPYVAYEDVDRDFKMTVRKFDGSSWVLVGNAGFTAGPATNISLRFSPNGTLYVGYVDFGNSNKASVMMYVGTAWTDVGNSGFSAGAAQYTRLAFASDSTPYLAYEDGGNSNKATVMKFNGSSWSAVGSAGFSAGTAQHLSLAFDASGAANLTYQDANSSSKATMMRFNGTSWALSGSVGFSPDVASYLSLAFSPYGIPVVAFEDGGNSNKATVMRLNVAPTVTTGDATNVAASSARLNGTAGDNGVPAMVTFEYGATTNYGSTVAASTPAGGVIAAATGSGAIAADLSTLLPNTLYHFRANISADGATVNGADKTFTTPKATSTILTQPTASTIQYGQSLAFSTLTGGSANTAGTFSWTSASTMPDSGITSYSVTFTPTDPNYAATTLAASVTVIGNDIVLAGANGVGVTYGSGQLLHSSINPGGIGAAVDANGNVFSVYGNGSSLAQYDHIGRWNVIMPAPNLYGGRLALAVDGSNQVWVIDGHGILYPVHPAAGIFPDAASTNSIGAGSTAMAIDNSGNIWLTNTDANTVDEVIGLADPVAPLANAVQSNTLGVKP